MTTTTLEQSRHLVELGIPMESADMTYEKLAIGNNFPEELQYRLCLTSFKYYSGIGVPAWSLSALLELMPETIKADYELTLQKDGYGYIVSYTHVFGDEVKDLCYFIGDTPIEAAYKMVVWLAENGHIETTKDKEQ